MGAGETVWIVGIALLGLVALLFALVALGRRQERNHLRQIVDAIDEIRSGNLGKRVDVPTRSPVAYVAYAVNRLGEDLASRTREAETADERLKTLLDAARDYAVVLTDLDLDVRSFSATATDLFGREEEDVLSRPVSELFEERSWAELLPKLTRRSFRERGVLLRATMSRADGGSFPAEVSFRAIPGAAGRPAGFLVLVKDIRGQVRLEEELRESELRYRALFEALAEGAFLLQDGKIALANPAFAALCGHPLDRVIGKPLRDHVATRDLMVLEERLDALQARGAGIDEVRFTLLGSDGRRSAVVRLRAAAVRLDGRPAVLGSLRDETTERLVEQELRRNESRLDAVLEATSDGILLVDDDPAGGVARMTNRAFLEMFALGERDVLGAPEGDLLRLLRERGDGAETVGAFLASATRGSRTERVALGGDRPRILELRATALPGPGGSLLGRVLACRDITDQKAFEERLQANAEALAGSKAELEKSYVRLQAIQEEVARRALEEESLNRELKTLNEMKTNLLANVSHELQTPLVSIRGYTEMILRGRLGAINEEQRKGLTLSLKNIDRLIAMIDSLVAFTRTPAETTELKLETFALEPAVAEAIDLLRAKAAERRIELVLGFPEREVAVHADREKILQVFVNLFSNGIKFNREGGRVEVRVAPGKPGLVEVQVQDTGVGIPRDEIEKIFERSFRGRTAAGSEGSGIGLSLVRSILRLHGCSIRAESEEGRGTTFFLTLPAAGSKPREGSVDSAPEAPRDPHVARGIAADAASSQPPENRVRPRFRIIRPPAVRE